MAELIITEKPSAAKKVAQALADGKAIKESINKVPFYKATHKGKDLLIAAAVGHLYTVGEKEKTPWSRFPVYDVEWVPTSEVDKTAKFSKKYLTVLKKLCKESKEFTVATDYDIEGEVIGLNIIRKICKQKDANRMKFSTLTKPDLLKAYENKSASLDWGQANAGETRHLLDFYYGINLTRALTDSINKASGGFKVLSSGRVQGPALKILVDREKDIRAFVPKPYWQLELNGKIKESAIKALHKTEKFWAKESAQKIFEKVKIEKTGTISETEKKQFNQSPPTPCDLTSMQIEAYRVFRIRPKQTLEIAQNLYTEGYISYPRTSSQKLPPIIDYRKILNSLKHLSGYKRLASKLLEQKKLKPREGAKDDPAHPAIYPTGKLPEKRLGTPEKRIYDLIVRRFMAVFGDDALKEGIKAKLEVNSHIFFLRGRRILEEGWMTYYRPYVRAKDVILPPIKEGDIVFMRRVAREDKFTSPPPRYNPSSLLKKMEELGIGTKATRADIIQTLYNRKYVMDERIIVTDLGFDVIDVLGKYAPTVVSAMLTRELEDKMEQIQKGTMNREAVLKEVIDNLKIQLEQFKENEETIGETLSKATKKAQTQERIVGKCPNCETGQLTIIYSKKTKKRFIGCTNYFKGLCNTSFPLPQRGTIKPSRSNCKSCGWPNMLVWFRGRKPWNICFNPDCSSNKKRRKTR